jgi:molybdopterin synthase sulfur carrier subunit
MATQVTIPTPLRRFTGEDALVEVESDTITGILDELDRKYPGLRSRLCEEGGQLRRFFNIYVDGEDVRFLNDLDTKVPAGAEVTIIPAISGGSAPPPRRLRPSGAPSLRRPARIR